MQDVSITTGSALVHVPITFSPPVNFKINTCIHFQLNELLRPAHIDIYIKTNLNYFVIIMSFVFKNKIRCYSKNSNQRKIPFPDSGQLNISLRV